MVLIGKKIKELRKKNKYTQKELAEKVGVTKSTIAAYENDSRLPSYDVLIKIADIFRTSLDSLLLNRSENTIDITGLNPDQINILKNLIFYFRKSESVDAFYSNNQDEITMLTTKFPEVFKDESRK